MAQKTSIFILTLCFLLASKSYGQAERDTLFYELKTEMIEEARVDSISFEETVEYWINVQLIEKYHAEFAKLTSDNIDNFLAVVYDGEIIAPSLPTIKGKISRGRFPLGPYKKKEKAAKVREQILSEDD